MFSKPSLDGNKTSFSQMSAPGCSAFGSGFLRNKASTYASLMGITKNITTSKHVEFKFDKTLIKQNAKRLMTELFNDMGIYPSLKAEE